MESSVQRSPSVENQPDFAPMYPVAEKEKYITQEVLSSDEIAALLVLSLSSHPTNISSQYHSRREIRIDRYQRPLHNGISCL
jgi:hypothetical protein